MTEHPHVPAAFINNIRDEGTKGEACDWLQKQWDEICALTAEIKRLRAEVACWRKNSVDTHAALTTMRNSINEYLPIPSLESDLLQGPETSVFCAVVANSVIAEILRFRAALADAEASLWRVAPNCHTISCELNNFTTPDPFEGPGETYRAAYERTQLALAEAREVMKPLAVTYKRYQQMNLRGEDYDELDFELWHLKSLSDWLERNQ